MQGTRQQQTPHDFKIFVTNLLMYLIRKTKHIQLIRISTLFPVDSQSRYANYVHPIYHNWIITIPGKKGTRTVDKLHREPN